jgi:hypothetical protein
MVQTIGKLLPETRWMRSDTSKEYGLTNIKNEMRMKQLLLIVTLVFNFVYTFGQQLAPVSKTVGKLNITVDPRMELLSAVQVISDYPTINRKAPYGADLMQFFGKYATHEACQLTSMLAANYDFAHDAPVDFILRLSQVPELKAVHPFSDRMIERANGKSNLEKYSDALHHFALESNFTEFWNNKKPYYQKMVEYTANDLSDFDPVGKMERYYNESKNSYTVTLSPAFAGGYGLRVPTPNDGLDIYGCLNVSEMKGGIPYFNKLGLSHFVWHEFSHSFINPLTDKYKARVEASSKLFAPLKAEMSYKQWWNCVNEHIIRAIYVRLISIYENEDAAKMQLDDEKSFHFAYIEPLVEKLKKFENERNIKNITFSEFYPKLLDVFDSLSHSNNEYLLNPPFSGPIRNVLNSRKIAIIYPTNGSDTTVLRSLFNYTSNIHKIKNEVSILCADSVALKMDLSDYSIMAYGTIESNLFLNKYKEAFPFKISGNTILTDKKLEGSKLRIIACLPNPTNNKKGMMVNTSTSNRNIKGVSNPFTDDFVVFEDIENILQHGFFKKVESWTF